MKILIKTLAKSFLVDLLSNLQNMSEETLSKTPLVLPPMTADKTVPHTSDMNHKLNDSGTKNNWNELLYTLNFFIKNSLAEFKTVIINMIETHTERPLSLGE